MNYYKERAIQIEEELEEAREELKDAREEQKNDLDNLQTAQEWVNRSTNRVAEGEKRVEALEKELAEIVDSKV